MNITHIVTVPITLNTITSTIPLWNHIVSTVVRTLVLRVVLTLLFTSLLFLLLTMTIAITIATTILVIVTITIHIPVIVTITWITVPLPLLLLLLFTWVLTWTSKTVLLLSLQPLLVALLFTLLSPEVALQPGPFCLAQPLAGKRRCRLPHTGREQRGAAERLAWRAREVAMDFLGKKGEKMVVSPRGTEF